MRRVKRKRNKRDNNPRKEDGGTYVAVPAKAFLEDSREVTCIDEIELFCLLLSHKAEKPPDAINGILLMLFTRFELRKYNIEAMR